VVLLTRVVLGCAGGLLLPCATEGRLHETALGMGGGLVAVSVFGSGKTDRFEPLFFVLGCLSEEDLFWATEPPAVAFCEEWFGLEIRGL
jgi:hypothetical protein